MTLRQQYLDLSADAKQGEFLTEWVGEEGLRRQVLPIQEFNRMVTEAELGQWVSPTTGRRRVDLARPKSVDRLL